MTAQARSGRGLFESLTALATTTVAMAQTRLALLALDVEDLGQRWLATVLLALGGMLLLATGLVLGTLALVMAFWDTHRVLVLGATAGAYLVTGIAVGAWLMHRLRHAPRAFDSSLAELAKDHQQLTAHR